MRRTQTLALALAAIVSIAAPVIAQPAPGPRDATKAEDLFREGNRLVTQQKWTEAEAKFRAALELNPTFDVAMNLGQTQYRLGKHRDAAESLSFALGHWPLILKEKRDTAERRLAEVKKQIGTVAIRVDVPGATVRVDGVVAGTSPIDHELFVEPGTHAIEATLAGYDGAKVTIEAAKGSEHMRTLTLRAATPPPPPAASAKAPPPLASAGAIPPGVERGGPNAGVLIAGGALAGVGVIVGGVLAGLSNGKASAADEIRSALVRSHGKTGCGVASPPASCRTLSDTVDARNTLANAALWSFIGAGAIGAGTLIYALAAPRDARKAGVIVVPAATRTGGGLMLTGAW